jgi:hypothetical protein
MKDNTAKMLGTVAIWSAVATSLIFGVFRMSWTGELSMLFMLLIVLIICVSASISTMAIWGRGAKFFSTEESSQPRQF